MDKAQVLLSCAHEAGFPLAATLTWADALGALTLWSEHAQGSPYALDNEAHEKAMGGATAVLMLAMPFALYTGYPQGVGRVSAYYEASNRAHHAAIALADALKERGIPATQARDLRLKPLARAAGMGDYGRNGVILRRGSHITLQALLLEEEIPLPPLHSERMPCDDCRRCEQACPTGALSDGRVDVSLCLRTCMEGKEAPAALAPHMGDRLLGCDTCLGACPGKEWEAMPAPWGDLFSFEHILDDAWYQDHAKEIAALIGRNYAKSLPLAAKRWRERQHE